MLADRLRVCQFCGHAIVHDGVIWVLATPTAAPYKCVHPSSEQGIHLPNPGMAERQDRIIEDIERKRIP